jgi:tetratricopeptide (TPR) repeat protein
LGTNLLARAWIEQAEGNTQNMHAYLAEARALVERINEPNASAYWLFFDISLLARSLGDLDAARDYLERCARFLPQLRSKLMDALVYSELAHVERQVGAWQAALDYYRDTILRWQDLGHRAAVANQLECFAFIARAHDQVQRAIRLLGAADALRAALNAPMTDDERIEYDREIAALRSQSEAATFAVEWAAGGAMTLDQAVAYARS